MPNQFLEHTHGDTLYRVENDFMRWGWRVTAYTSFAGHDKRLGNSLMVREEDVDHELAEMDLDQRDFQTRAACALRLAMIRLEPQIAYQKRKLRGEDELAVYEERGEELASIRPGDYTMDPVLKKALEAADREKKAAEEKARTAREAKECEQETMESNELWGAF